MSERTGRPERVRIRCPSTGQIVETKIETDVEALAQSWRSEASVRCPHCGEQHMFSVRDAFLDDVVFSDEFGRGR